MDISKRLYSIVMLLAFAICFVAIYESFNLQQKDSDTQISNILQKARKKVSNSEIMDIMTPLDD